MTPAIAAALDRAGVTDRFAVLIIAAVATSLGHDKEELSLNRSTVRRARQTFRQEIAANLKSDLDISGFVVVHWDGKLLEDLTGREVVNRLPVLVSSGQQTELLGVPKLTHGTGEAEADAVLSMLKEWLLLLIVVGMCFDTTSSNTGSENGACILLEKKLKRDLLHLACRHHVAELIVKAAYETLFGASSAPEVPLFKRFREAWVKFKCHTFQEEMLDASMLQDLAACRDRVVAFARRQLDQAQPRDDYKEFLHLVLCLLGAFPAINFKIPGAVSHARWMSKVLYCLKIWLFRAQFSLTAAETTRLRKMCIFVVRVYVEYWFCTTQAVSAPRTDLCLMQTLLQISSSKKDEYGAAAAKLSRHLWYISEELIAFAFFDDEVSLDEKRRMVQALNTRQGSSSRAVRLKIPDPEVLSSSSISDFVSKNTQAFFEISGLPTSFLERDPEEWAQCSSYRQAREVVQQVRVVNDTAERGVALIERFNKKHTKNEEQLQYLLLVVQEHRRQVGDFQKSTLVTAFAKK